ncbi:MAG: hypothetical protein HY360_00690 [Verrucomicrobia bacterium]|nr:hypothetical protein [Verrucomicrobiota bacterium]
MSAPIHILYFQGKNPDASKHVRVLEPLYYLEKRGHKTTAIDSLETAADIGKTLDACHILLISNVDITPANFEFFKQLVAFCNLRKKLVICDFDDFYGDVPESNPFRKCTLPWDFVRQIMGMAHVITVTGRELQQALAPFHPRIVVLPNMIDFRKFTPRPRQSKTLRIGWAGGASHLRDLLLIAESIRGLQKKHRFEFIVYGMFADFTKPTEIIVKHAIQPREVDDPFHRAFVEFARQMHGVEYTTKPVQLYQDFPQSLAQLDLDIGLCPIEDNLFNRCRSALKFYQYAAVQTAAVASKVYPYSDEPVLVAENTVKSWTETLEMLVLSRAVREETTRLQYQHVVRNRNYEINGVLWELLYQQLIQTLCA